MGKVIVELYAELEAGPDSIWFTEEQLAEMSDSDLKEIIEESLWDLVAEGAMTIERVAR